MIAVRRAVVRAIDLDGPLGFRIGMGNKARILHVQPFWSKPLTGGEYMVQIIWEEEVQ